MARVAERLQRWRRDRPITRAERAGEWSRYEARKRMYAYAKRARWLLTAVLGATGLLSLFVLLVPPRARGSALGAIVASGVWWAWMLVVVGSGAAPLMMGDLGEQWTADELRRFERGGWRVIHRALLKEGGDIDHILIGPPGLFVLETKWSAQWDDRPYSRRTLEDAIQRTAERRRVVSLFAKPTSGDAPVRSAVVLWSADSLSLNVDEYTRSTDATVLHGRDLRTWLEAFEGRALDGGAIELTYRLLVDQVATRDAYELEQQGPPPRGIKEVALTLLGVFVGALAGLLTVAAVAKAIGSLNALVALLALAALPGIGWLLQRRMKWGEALIAGWTATVTGAALAAVVITVVLWVR